MEIAKRLNNGLKKNIDEVGCVNNNSDKRESVKKY